MNYTISTINHRSKYFEQVIQLGEANKKTLGFFPRGAFEQHAVKKQIIIAVDDETDIVQGYLLYGLSRRKMLASIVHLCIDTKQRGRGMTRELFSALKEQTKQGYKAIRVHCRVDYDANSLWPKLGFQNVGEKAGRSKDGKTTLGIWMFDHGHPTLFSYAEQQSENIKVAIDANVFYQLQYPEVAGNEESITLWEPWLEIDLYLTPEIFNEIARNKNKTKKEKTRKFAYSFPISKSSDDEYESTREKVFSLLPKAKNISDESDRRQLARAISAGILFFVTRDRFLLDQRDLLHKEFGVLVIQPSDLILQRDEVLRQAEYFPSRLAGSQIKIEKVHTQQTKELLGSFLAPQEETKGKFNHKLQIYLSDPRTYETSIVRDFDKSLALMVQEKRDTEILIPLLRLERKPISKIMIRYLINKIILDSSKAGIHVVRISDKYLSETVLDALKEYGFVKISKEWIKISFQEILNTSELLNMLSSRKWEDNAKHVVQSIIQALNAVSIKETELMLEIEKTLWPLKITDIDIPTFVVAIQPDWAMHLFDDTIANQNLFGSNSALMFNTENVYYRSARPKYPSAPSRVLWYVSKGKGKYQNTMQLKACSYVDGVDIGKPKELFRQYKKLGIYSWEQVFSIAKKDLDKDLMVFLFSKTEVFVHPISNDELQIIWKEDGKKFNIFGPIKISQERFLKLYSIGQGKDNKK
ncbi:MAG: hypothetical protein DRN14_05815 [Thermoplasmata archaeon]|nr:MAG: hypothetical protein DRN14_05815 [Thermoplasmata archaeon]